MKRDSCGGFSLVEVVLALGLLAAVLLSVCGLFLLGERQVRSGRAHSSALAVARDILEEMSARGFHDLHVALGLDGSAAAYTVDTRSNAFAAGWQRALDRELRGAHARIELRSVGEGAAVALREAVAVRLTVTVFWSEGPRARRVRLATLRT
jgi:Tfp pilus assembly protein PilV